MTTLELGGELCLSAFGRNTNRDFQSALAMPSFSISAKAARKPVMSHPKASAIAASPATTTPGIVVVNVPVRQKRKSVCALGGGADNRRNRASP